MTPRMKGVIDVNFDHGPLINPSIIDRLRTDTAKPDQKPDIRRIGHVL